MFSTPPPEYITIQYNTICIEAFRGFLLGSFTLIGFPAGDARALEEVDSFFAILRASLAEIDAAFRAMLLDRGKRPANIDEIFLKKA